MPLGRKEETVLVIADEEVIRTSLRSILESEGYRVLTAERELALTLFLEESPHLVVVDMGREGREGCRFCRELRSLPSGEDLPVVMLVQDPDEADRALAAGATDVLYKLSQLNLLVLRVKILLPLGRKIRDLAESAARSKRALRTARLGVWEWDPLAGKMWLTEEASRILRLEPHVSPVTFQGFLALVYPPDRQLVDTRLKRASQQKGGVTLEFRVKWPHGTLGSVSLRGEPLDGDAAGPFPCFGGILVDMTEQRLNDDRLRLLREAIDSLPIGITISDLQGRIIYANPAEAKLHGMTMMELLSTESAKLGPTRYRRALPQDQWESFGPWRRESVNVRKNGEEFPVHLTSIAVRDAEGRPLGIVTTCEDITVRKQAEQRVQRLAYYDALTDLPNRWMFQDRLQQALAFAGREGRQVGLLFLDLDNFKEINDGEGHDFGDRVLREVGRRLASGMRESDTLARLGGDEFVVVLTTLSAHETAAIAAERLLSLFGRPIEIDGRTVQVGVSVGIAIFPDDACDAEGLLKRADAAMYQAKQDGKQGFRFFSRDFNENIMRLAAIESALQEGLDRGEFFLHYQPLWGLRSGEMVGAEALVRWQSPEFGFLPPSEFIPLAERAGLMAALGEWVMRTACRQAMAWEGGQLGTLPVTVNVSAAQFRQRHFLRIVDGILAETGVNPARLELEFPEKVLMEDADRGVTILTELKKRGIRSSIDDFGTGSSSLAYLSRFPVTKLKIAPSFLTEIASNAFIIAGILSLGKSLNLTVVAEGVENVDQLEFLAARGCDEIQGFYVARPMTADKLPSCTFCSSMPAGQVHLQDDWTTG